MRRFGTAFVLLLCLLGITACLTQPVSRSWGIADLRWFGSADAPTPATDIIAVYTRTTALTVDIRVDLLDINPGDQYKFKLVFWDNRYFSKDPLILDLSSTGEAQTSGTGDGKPVIWPLIIQNFGMDTITVSLNRFLVGDRYHLDVSTYTTNPVKLADEARNIRSDGQPPEARVPVLIAFWDTFPAATPAQALRRWDGAHTGPYGDRHGLKLILDGAQQYKVPVALLDIKNPASLAALDYVGSMAQTRYLVENGLLILPDVAYAEPADISLNFSRQAAAGFGLPVSQFVYDASYNIQTNYLAQFYPLADAFHLAHSGGTRLIPLPAADRLEATDRGPSLDVRRELVDTASQTDPASLVVLGGSLPNSGWGDAERADPTFDWIANHPWIQPLNGESLMAFPAGLDYHKPLSKTPATTPWLSALRSAPNNVVTQLAWQAYLTLSVPAADSRLQALQTDYLGQVGELLMAARWAAGPSVQAACVNDLEGVGQVECVISNLKYFAIIDPSGARLTNLFYLDAIGAHQLVGPSSQFAVGLSDPSEWHPENGIGADPSVIPGAFADGPVPWPTYKTTVTPDRITCTSPDGKQVKTYSLTENGIEVRYQAPDQVITRIPLTVDPQAFYSGPASYLPNLAPHSWTWSLLNGIGVEVQTDATLSAEGYVSSFPFLFMPEDPNLDYPSGHYFPFPLSVVTIQGQGNFNIQITVPVH